MSKDSPARYYQKKKSLAIQKKSRERHQNLPDEEKKTKSENIVVNDIEIS